MPSDSEMLTDAEEHRAVARAFRMRASMATDLRDIERLVLLARRREKLAIMAMPRRG